MWMQTYSGKMFRFDYPTAEMISIEDIAHALSNMCRFNGHIKSFYSVAQHSVLCSYQHRDKAVQRWCLMHDATEAYIADVVRPLKSMDGMAFYRAFEDKLMGLIARVFNLGPEPPEVREIDLRMLATEAGQLFLTPPPSSWNVPDPYPDVSIEPLKPREAKNNFLDRYRMLFD